MQASAPDRIGRYLVIERLGAGGIGEVFLAQREGDPRLCALKRLQADKKELGTARARILREAHVATFLDHPSIASVIGAGDEDGSFCIATEFVPGCDLHRILAAMQKQMTILPLGFTFAIARAVLEALAYAHTAKDQNGAPLHLVHRDISTRNVMISFAGQVKVIDFGVARARIDEFRTQAGVLVGSPSYVAPEQATAEPVDHRADLYSFSAVLFEMLTGRRLANGATLTEILYRVVSEEAPPVSSVNRALPRELDPILARGLAKDPAKRWPDARSYLEALAPIADRIGVATREELGGFVRSLFPAEEQKAAQLIARARVRFEEPEPAAITETRAAFWERTLVRRTPPPIAPKKSRRSGPWVIASCLAAAIAAIVAILVEASEVEEAPVAIAPAAQAFADPPAPMATPRTVAEAPPPIAAPPPRSNRAPTKPKIETPPPAEPARDDRSPDRRRLDGLRARGAGSNDPELQAFVADLEQRAKGNTRAEVELKKLALCMIDRSCGGERLYRAVAKAVSAIEGDPRD